MNLRLLGLRVGLLAGLLLSSAAWAQAVEGNVPNQPVLGQAVFAFTPTLTLGFDAR